MNYIFFFGYGKIYIFCFQLNAMNFEDVEATAILFVSRYYHLNLVANSSLY